MMEPPNINPFPFPFNPPPTFYPLGKGNPIPPPPSPSVPTTDTKTIPGMFAEPKDFLQIRSLLVEILAVLKDIQANLQSDMVCSNHNHGDE